MTGNSHWYMFFGRGTVRDPYHQTAHIYLVLLRVPYALVYLMFTNTYEKVLLFLLFHLFYSHRILKQLDPHLAKRRSQLPSLGNLKAESRWCFLSFSYSRKCWKVRRKCKTWKKVPGGFVGLFEKDLSILCNKRHYSSVTGYRESTEGGRRQWQFGQRD